LTKVVLDTNVLMMVFQFQVDLEGELIRLLGAVEIIVPDSCVRELSGLSDRKAKAALMLAQRFKVMPAKGKGDDAVLGLAKELSAVLVTNDAQLRKRAKSEGLKVAHMRGRDHLALE